MKFAFGKKFGAKPGQVEPVDAGVHLTELDERLAGPEKAAVRKEIGARLTANVATVETMMKSGLSRQAYQDADAIRRGLVAARDFIVGPQVN